MLQFLRCALVGFVFIHVETINPAVMNLEGVLCLRCLSFIAGICALLVLVFPTSNLAVYSITFLNAVATREAFQPGSLGNSMLSMAAMSFVFTHFSNPSGKKRGRTSPSFPYDRNYIGLAVFGLTPRDFSDEKCRASCSDLVVGRESRGER